MDQDTHGEKVPAKRPKTDDQKQSSDQSSGRSGASLKTDHSKWEPGNVHPMAGPTPQSHPGSSGLSLKSDCSKLEPLNFCPKSGDTPESQSGLSGVSLKSDSSKFEPLNFRPVPEPATQVQDPEDLNTPSQLDDIFTRLEEEIVMFVKEQLRRLYRVLDTDCPESASDTEEEQSSREAMLKITLDFLKKMKRDELAERLQTKSTAPVSLHKLKSCMQHRFGQVFEGVAKAGNSMPLHQIYTELFMSEGGTSEVNQEHEVRQIEAASRIRAESTIACKEIFKQQLDSEKPIRTVLTKGVAGVGKTVLTQKFSLDWAEGKANQDIQLLFPFTFRELNVLRDTRFSLMGLLRHFFSEIKGPNRLEHLKVLFIFDGLDECRLPLDFSRTQVLTEPTESASVEVLLVNLIRGSLLPSARLWITTRPAAANQIPAWCVSMVTEVKGFTDLQKEEFFRKRFSDEKLAIAIISHLKTIRSLYIMCYLPIFCWILSTVIQKMLEQPEKQQLPETLTEMYVHFLVVQVKIKKIKYHDQAGTDLHWIPKTREMVQSLGKLAFEQLQKGNLIFYESDLRDCGLDAAAASVYSGVFTQMFREESGLYQNKVYCFIHLSVQEFLAALYVHETFFSSGVNLLSTPDSSESPECFYRSAVDQALASSNGHLDLFLRFLLGLSLPTNQSLLQGLLTRRVSSSLAKQETVEYIREKLDEILSTERSLNLIHCLNELKEHSLMEEIKNLTKRNISSNAWHDLSMLLLSSHSNLEEFDLRQHQASEAALFGLLSVVKASTKANLSSCNLSPLSCGRLASVLMSSSLTHLDLSNNDLQDSGVEWLCFGLKSPTCKLQSLSLSGCMVSERGGAAVASALSSTSSCLRELDLSYNHLGPSAELLTALQNQPHGSLESLKLEPAGAQWLIPGLQKYYTELTLDQNKMNRFLRLSDNQRTVTSVREKQPSPEHVQCFEWPQILSSSALSDGSYWEVQWSGGVVDVAVSYRGIQREGNRKKCEFGIDHQSWALRISVSGFSVRHNNHEIALSTVTSPAPPVPLSHLKHKRPAAFLACPTIPSPQTSGSSPGSSDPAPRSSNPSPGSSNLFLRFFNLFLHSSNTSPRSSNPSLGSSNPFLHSSNPSPRSSNTSPQLYSSGRVEVLLDSKPFLHSSNPSPGSSNPFLRSSNPSLCSSNLSLRSSNPSLRSSNPSLCSSNPFLRSSNPSPGSSNPSLRSSNPSPPSSNTSPQLYSSGRIGVLLHSDSLSFFNVSSGSRVHLYTFNTVFTEPVFAGFWLWNTGSSVSLVDVTQSPQAEPKGTRSDC